MLALVTSDTIWTQLSAIPVGTIIAWIVVILAIIGVAIKIGKKIYNVFLKYESLKKENIEAKEKIAKAEEKLKSHDEMFKKIQESLDRIEKALNEQKDVNMKQIRHSLVQDANSALDAGQINATKLASMEEMFEEYTTIFHGNGYVHTMMDKVRQLDVIGSIDQ